MNETGRLLPPMFARAVGEGDECASCRHRSSARTVKALLPDGIQVCKVCDA